jgi:hypothetical protein
VIVGQHEAQQKDLANTKTNGLRCKDPEADWSGGSTAEGYDGALAH